jgi:ATP phosphoribosyltransferase regulatory subunit
MAYHPPTGARDLLPLDLVQRHWIENLLRDTFQRWGYHWIETSTIERVDTLTAGGAVQRRTVIPIQSDEDGDLGLRPELTASIARAAISRMATVTHPQRLYYCTNVFRQPQRNSSHRQQEFFQAGVELLGMGGITADAEVLLLVVDCLERLGLDGWQLLVGEASLTRSLLHLFPERWRDTVRSCLARLDRVALETLPLTPELQARALALFELRGEPATVLQRLSQWDLDPAQRAMVENLKTTVDLLQDLSGDRPHPLPIVLDLSTIQTFDYYTGLVFEVVSSPATDCQRLGQGGRYDHLLGLYDPEGKSYPGIGFCINLEPLHQVLLKGDRLPQELPASDWLVVPTSERARAGAFAYAQELRDPNAGQVRVEVDLQGERDRETVRQVARDRRIARIAWIADDGSAELESITSLTDDLDG